MGFGALVCGIGREVPRPQHSLPSTGIAPARAEPGHERVPAAGLDAQVTQLHSGAYRNPGDIPAFNREMITLFSGAAGRRDGA